MSRSGLLSLLWPLIAAGCLGDVSSSEAPGSGVWERNGQTGWTLIEDLRLGSIDADPDQQFGNVRDVFPDSLGRTWIFDSQALELRAFSGTGDLVLRAGGRGEGPGEFRGNSCAFPSPGGEVWVESGGQWHRFNASGQFVGQQKAFATECAPRAWRGETLIAESYIRNPEAARSPVDYILLERGTPGDHWLPVDTFAAPPLQQTPELIWKGDEGRSVVTGVVPLEQRSQTVLTPRGELLAVENGQGYLVRRLSVEGRELASFGRPDARHVVPDSVRQGLIGALTHPAFGRPVDFDEREVPQVFPPIDRVHPASDGHVWIERRVTDGAGVFDVFDPSGQFLGTVEPPFDPSATTVNYISDSHIYITEWDEFDVPYVRRFRIQR